ncbi:hypothetical protein H9P43_003631 [Blastocladiella emersonii ATCC 22665]|nr:hypothetical protein H9P43_003631 [Blastocladiella emersonii ATCC 22665]
MMSAGLSRTGSVSSVVADPSSGARRRHKAKDDAIRRKVDQELMRKSGRRTPARSQSQASLIPHAKAGTVAALRPTPPVTIRQSVRAFDAAQLMAARRCDALLVVDQQDRLCGIITDKDLAFRVVAEGLDINSTKVFEVMTKNVQFVNANSTASEALSTMISGGFRHLPVMDDEGDVVGVLDITKCLYEALERIDTIYGSSKKLTDALEDVQRDWASTGINAALSQQFEMIRQKMLCPDLSSILSAESMMPPELTLKATVKDAARAMKQFKSTAVLIFEDNHRLAGIFTSKDIVLRVMSVKADPSVTSIIRVMTPHPDTCNTNTSIYDALKMMHDNRYLHLPVVDGTEVIGLVDVLKLTYNVLEKITAAREQDGPAWNEFWTSTFAPENNGTTIGGDTESLLSHPERSGGGVGGPSAPSLIRPSDSASVVSDSVTYLGGSGTGGVPGFDPEQCFIFKFRDPSTLQVHRVTSPTNLAFLVSLLKEKIGAHVEINTLSYSDEDGDDIAVQCDADLAAAVAMARDAGQRRILLKINGVSSGAEPAQFPRRRTSGMTGVNGHDDTATELYQGNSADLARAMQASPGSNLSHGSASAPASASAPRERSATAATVGDVVGYGAVAGAGEVQPAAPGAVAAAAAGPKPMTWLDNFLSSDKPLEHPVVLVGMGALVTLSLVGLVSLIRR